MDLVWLHVDCATVSQCFSSAPFSSSLTFLLSIIHDEMLLFCLCVNVLLMSHLTKRPLISVELTCTTLKSGLKISSFLFQWTSVKFLKPGWIMQVTPPNGAISTEDKLYLCRRNFFQGLLPNQIHQHTVCPPLDTFVLWCLS